MIFLPHSKLFNCILIRFFFFFVHFLTGIPLVPLGVCNIDNTFSFWSTFKIQSVYYINTQASRLQNKQSMNTLVFWKMKKVSIPNMNSCLNKIRLEIGGNVCYFRYTLIEPIHYFKNWLKCTCDFFIEKDYDWSGQSEFIKWNLQMK